MKTKNYILRLLIGGIFALTPAIAQQVLTNNNGLFAFAGDINLRGDVVGTLGDVVSPNFYGYYYSNNGLSAAVSPLPGFCQPGACAAPSQIAARAINDSGLIVGEGARIPGSSYAKGWFCTAPCNSYTVVDVPGANVVRLTGVSNTGVIVGAWEDANYLPHAFIRDERGRVTTFDAPNISRTAPTYLTPGIVINGNGDTAGHFVDTANRSHIFYRTAKGQVSTYDIPGALNVGVTALNNSGVIVGEFAGSDGRGRGFMFAVGGRKSAPVLTVCDHVNSPFGQTIVAINNNGIGVGYSTDANYVSTSFRCNPNGTTSSLDLGPSGSSTAVVSINDNNVFVATYNPGSPQTTTPQTIISPLF